MGTCRPNMRMARDTSQWVDRLPLLVMIGCSIFFGIFPMHFYNVVRSTVVPMLDRINQVAPVVTQNTTGLLP